MMKYAAHRGPWHDAPVAERVKFWAGDLAYCIHEYHVAKAAGDTRVVRLMQRQREAAFAQLAAIGAQRSQA